MFEDDMIMSEDSRRNPKSSEGKVFTCFSLQKSEILHMVFIPYMGLS